MSINPAEDRFLDYLEGRLTEAERGEFEQALSSSPALKRQLQEYVAVSNLGDEISKQEFELGAGFTAELMQQIDGQSRSRAGSAAGVPLWFRRMLAPAALCATAVVALLVSSANKSMDVPIVLPQHSARSVEQSAVTVTAAGQATVLPSLPKAKTETTKIFKGEFAGEKGPTAKAAGGAALERSSTAEINEFNQGLLDAESSPIPPSVEQRDFAQPQELAPLKEPAVLKAEETAQMNLAQGSPAPAASNKMNSDKAAATAEAKRDLLAPSSAPVESDGIEAFGDLAAGPQSPPAIGERDRDKKSADVNKARVATDTAALQAEVLNAGAERQVEGKAKIASVGAVAPANVAPSSESVLRDDLRLLSTPSIRLDRGAFAAIAESIAAGALPAPADVKPADLINQFNFDYSSSAPKAAGPVAVFVEIAPSPLEQDRLLVMIGLKQRSSALLSQLRFRISLNSKQVASYVPAETIEMAKIVSNSGSVEVGDELIDPQMLLAGRSATLLYEISLRSSDSSYREAELGEVKLSYSTSERRDSLASLRVPLAFAGTTNVAQANDSDFKFAAAVNYFCRILRGDRSVRIADVLKLAQMSKGTDIDGRRSEFIAIAQRSAELLD